MPEAKDQAMGFTHTAAIAEQAGIEELMLDFLAYLELERGLSRNTLEAYRSDLLQFGAFLERRGIGHGAAVFTAFASAVVATRLLAGRLPDVVGPRRTAVGAAGMEALGLAIVAAAGRGTVDGEPVQGSLADFVASEVELLQPGRIVLCHHDDWMPPLTTPTDRFQAFLAGELEGGTAPAFTVLMARSQGVDIKLVAAIAQSPFSAAYIEREENWFLVTRLEGKDADTSIYGLSSGAIGQDVDMFGLGRWKELLDIIAPYGISEEGGWCPVLPERRDWLSRTQQQEDAMAVQAGAAMEPHRASLPKGAHVRVNLPGSGHARGKHIRKRRGRKP